MTPTDPARDNGDLDPATVAELRRLARSRPGSGREAVAKASAIRTLERLSRGKALGRGAADAGGLVSA